MISLFASVAFAAFVVSTVSGQSVPVVSINVGVDPVVLGGPVPLVLEPVPDLTFLTNHAALVSREFKKVKGVLVETTFSASTATYNPKTFYPYTDRVKTLEGIMALVTNTYYYQDVVDTNAPITIKVTFWDSTNEFQIMYGQVSGSAPEMIFEGSTGGVPMRNRWGQLELPQYAEEVSMRLSSSSIWIDMTNIGSVHLVYTNSVGEFKSTDFSVDWRRGFWFPPDFAGQGIAVFTWFVPDQSGNYNRYQHAYNLGTGKEEQITPVLVRALVRDSDDFRTSVDQLNLVYSIFSFEGMGKVPLLTPTYTAELSGIYLSVDTTDGDRWATSFLIEDLNTGIKNRATVQSGQRGVRIVLPRGSYHIIPCGLSLMPWMMYGGSVGKG